MLGKIRAFFGGDGLKKRTLRGVFLTAGVAFGEHGLRFISNLILTRLLFPEAFGLMALVQVVIIGLQMVSDVGFRAAVVQNPRGDDRDFLSTVWTLQILRGFFLWGAVLLLAPWMGRLYEQPLLAQLLPVAGLSLIIRGFFPSRVYWVQRKLDLACYSQMKVLGQFIGLIVTAVLAYLMGSVWALAWGLLAAPLAQLVLFAIYLPGPKDRLHIERSATGDIVKLGKYLFVSTIAAYVINQSDRAVLGVFIPVDLLGVYGIAFALATLPAMLARQIANTVVFPLYRIQHPLESAQNQRNIFRARRMISLGALTLTCIMAFLGPWLMDVLYDPRYQLAGPIAVLLATANVPLIVFNGVMNAALAKGDSFRFMVMNVTTALCQGLLIYLGARYFGVVGAALAIGGAQLATYPFLVLYMRRYGNWDAKGDAGLVTGGFALCAIACWLHWDKIIMLLSV